MAIIETPRPIRRGRGRGRRVLGALAAGATAALLTVACGGERAVSPSAGPAPTGGRLSIATGNTTGVFYQLGGGYADLITKNMPGWQATAETTGGSVENIQRVARGDADIGLTVLDAAGDAATGKGAFTAPQPIRALAKIYTSYAQVIARADAGIATVADMKGKRVSTGSPNSGVEHLAVRLLRAAGLDPAKDIAKQSLSLPEAVQGMKDGTVDALFWIGGLPTVGITELVTALKDEAVFVPLDAFLVPLQAEYGQVYQPATLQKDTYKIASDVPSIAVPNVIIVRDTMPDQLAHDLTRVLFEHSEELGRAHPEGRNIRREDGPKAEPVELHPGAAAYYDGT